MSKLFNKYVIKKSNGTPVDPTAEYFVLRIDSDPHARAALRAYAESVKENDEKFSNELKAWVNTHDTGVERVYIYYVSFAHAGGFGDIRIKMDKPINDTKDVQSIRDTIGGLDGDVKKIVVLWWTLLSVQE